MSAKRQRTESIYVSDDLWVTFLSFLSPLEMLQLNTVSKSWTALSRRALANVTILHFDNAWKRALTGELSLGRVLGFLQFCMRPSRIVSLIVSCSEALRNLPFVKVLGTTLSSVTTVRLTMDIAGCEDGVPTLCENLKKLSELYALPTGKGDLKLFSKPLTILTVIQPPYGMRLMLTSTLKRLVLCSWDTKDKKHREALAQCTQVEFFHVLILSEHDADAFVTSSAADIVHAFPRLDSLRISTLGKTKTPFRFQWLTKLRALSMLTHFSYSSGDEQINMDGEDVRVFYATLTAWPRLNGLVLSGPLAVPPSFFSNEYQATSSDALQLGVHPLASDYSVQDVARWLRRFPKCVLSGQEFTLRCEVDDEPMEWASCAGRIWASCQPQNAIGTSVKLTQALFNSNLDVAGVTQLSFSGDDRAVIKTLRGLVPRLGSTLAVCTKATRTTSGVLACLQTLPRLVVLSIPHVDFDASGLVSLLRDHASKNLSRVLFTNGATITKKLSTSMRAECKARAVDTAELLFSAMTNVKTLEQCQVVAPDKSLGLTTFTLAGNGVDFEVWTRGHV